MLQVSFQCDIVDIVQYKPKVKTHLVYIVFILFLLPQLNYIYCC